MENENQQVIREVVSEAVHAYITTKGTTMISRQNIPEFTGGLISRNYMRQLDHENKGCESIRVGNKVLYNVYTLGEWIIDRAS